MARVTLILVVVALVAAPGCHRGEGGAAAAGGSPGSAEAAVRPLQPLYGDMVSSSSPTTTVSYRTSYMPPVAELPAAEREAVTLEIHGRVASIQECVDTAALAEPVPVWAGTVRVEAGEDGRTSVVVAGAGSPRGEGCVRQAAATWQLLPAELGRGRTVEIPVSVERGR